MEFIWIIGPVGQFAHQALHLASSPGYSRTGGAAPAPQTATLNGPPKRPAMLPTAARSLVADIQRVRDFAVSTGPSYTPDFSTSADLRDCFWGCKAGYRKNDAGNGCYHYGITDMNRSKARVEFNLTYALSGMDFWNGVNGEGTWHPEKLIIDAISQSLEVSRPMASTICDADGCWGNFGFNPAVHGNYIKAGFGATEPRATETRRAVSGGGAMRRGVGFGDLSQKLFEVSIIRAPHLISQRFER